MNIIFPMINRWKVINHWLRFIVITRILRIRAREYKRIQSSDLPGDAMKAVTQVYILWYVPWSHAQPPGLLLALFWATFCGAMSPDTVVIVTLFISATAPDNFLNFCCSEAGAFLV